MRGVSVPPHPVCLSSPGLRPGSPRQTALSHQGRGGLADATGRQPRTRCPSPLVGEGFASCERSELEAKGEGEDVPELLIQTAVNTAYAASHMALIAVGLVLIFGVMGVINFAHGELYMAGAYAIVYLYAGMQLPFLVAVAIGLAFVGCLGLIMEWAMFRPLRDNPLGGLIASIGFLLVLQSSAVLCRTSRKPIDAISPPSGLSRSGRNMPHSMMSPRQPTKARPIATATRNGSCMPA